MICVLFNMAEVRLGEVRMPDDCRIIQFGGGCFVRTEVSAVLDAGPGELGVAFQAVDRYVLDALDTYNPRRTAHAQPRRPIPEATAVQGRSAAGSEVGKDIRR